MACFVISADGGLIHTMRPAVLANRLSSTSLECLDETPHTYAVGVGEDLKCLAQPQVFRGAGDLKIVPAYAFQKPSKQGRCPCRCRKLGGDQKDHSLAGKAGGLPYVIQDIIHVGVVLVVHRGVMGDPDEHRPGKGLVRSFSILKRPEASPDWICSARPAHKGGGIPWLRFSTVSAEPYHLVT
jgi:hypothetical protein